MAIVAIVALYAVPRYPHWRHQRTLCAIPARFTAVAEMVYSELCDYGRISLGFSVEFH